MRRLAPAIAAAVLALEAGGARAEPLDLDLGRLGAPDAAVWEAIAAERGVALTPAEAATLAKESKQRFAVLSSEVALALSSALLHPASTTGHSQFDFDIEAARAGVHSAAIGGANASLMPYPATWPTRTDDPPGSVFMPSLHVRKALPFSFEMGGRMIYLSRSSYFATQGELKWALNEGSEIIPDLAVRLAYTRLFGQKDWNLGATDLDFMVSKRWGFQGVTSFTPYVALRFTFVSASSDRIDFGPTTDLAENPVALADSSASFPKLRAGFYRTTLGVRFTAYTVSLAAEATLFAGSKYSGESNPTADEYPDFKLSSSFAGAIRFGWEF